MKTSLISTSIACFLLTACGGSGGGSSSVTLASEAQMSNAASATGTSLTADFNALKNSIDSFADDLLNNCSGTDVTQSQLEIWQGQWRAAMDNWMALQYVSLGPLASSRRVQVWPTTLTAKTNTFPAMSAKIDAILTDSSDLGVEANWNKGREYQGLQALEYLVYAPLADFTGNSRRCDYAKAASSHLKLWAQDIVDGSQDIVAQHWSGADGFEQNFINPGAASTPYASAQDLQQDWLTDFVAGFEDLKKYKLEQPLGWDEGACLKSESSSDKTFQSLPEMVEAPFSRQSLALAIVSYEKLQQRFNQSYAALLTDVSPGLKSQIEQWFAQGNAQKSTLENIQLGAFIKTYLVDGEDMDATANSQYQALQKFHQAVRNLTTNFKTDLAALLDVTVSFNAADGDSGRPTSTNCWPQ